MRSSEKFHSVSQMRAGLQSRDAGQLTLDVLSLAELQRLQVPPSDDSLKYRYRLQGDTYGKVGLVSAPVCPPVLMRLSPPSLRTVRRHGPGPVRRAESGS